MAAILTKVVVSVAVVVTKVCRVEARVYANLQGSECTSKRNETQLKRGSLRYHHRPKVWPALCSGLTVDHAVFQPLTFVRSTVLNVDCTRDFP